MSSAANPQMDLNENYVKFEKMVTTSHKLYTSNLFKNKEDRSRRRKLITRLRTLYDNTNAKGTFEDAVVECGWMKFKEWLQETNTIELESARDRIKLIQMLNSRKEINWTFIKGVDLEAKTLKGLVDLTSTLMKSFYDESKHLGPWSSEKMEQELTHKNSHCIVIRNNSNNELIGYICFRMEMNVVDVTEQYMECYVYELMIHQQYQ
eukprot:224897_1